MNNNKSRNQMKNQSNKDIDDLISEFESELSTNPLEKGLTCLPNYERQQKLLIERVSPPYNTNKDLEPIPRVFSNTDMVNDFIQIRNDLILILDSSKELLSNIPVANVIAKPSMITAIASLHGSINANGKMLLEIHEKILKLQKDYVLMSNGQNPDQPTINNITNNNNLMVNTKDLNQIIEDILKKEKEKGTD